MVAYFINQPWCEAMESLDYSWVLSSSLHDAMVLIFLMSSRRVRVTLTLNMQFYVM